VTIFILPDKDGNEIEFWKPSPEDLSASGSHSTEGCIFAEGASSL
jgi:hypothetical protein